jgi:hypothetical protein
MKTVSDIEINSLSKAYSVDSELNQLLGIKADFYDNENKSWDLLLERNGISNNISSVTFTALDHVVYSLAGITGGLLDLTKQYTKVMTNDSIAKSFEDKCKEYVNKITGKKNGIPAIDNIIGGPDHRMWGPTHDLARIFETIKGIMRGEFHLKIDVAAVDRLINTYSRKSSEYVKIENPIDAFIVLMLHLLSDFFTVKSLPIPGRTKLIENGDNKVILKVLKEYRKGGNLRQIVADFLNSLSSALFIAIFCRLYRYYDMYSSSGNIGYVAKNFQLKNDIKYYLLLRNASTICFVISVGKAAFSRNIFDINYINFVQIIQSGMSINRLSISEQNLLLDRFENNIAKIERI